MLKTSSRHTMPLTKQHPIQTYLQKIRQKKEMKVYADTSLNTPETYFPTQIKNRIYDIDWGNLSPKQEKQNFSNLLRYTLRKV